MAMTDSKRKTAHDSAARLKRVQIDYATVPGMPYSIHACTPHEMQYQMVLNFFHMVATGKAAQHGFARDWHSRMARNLVYENLMDNAYFQRAESVASRMTPEQIRNVQRIIDALNVEALEQHTPQQESESQNHIGDVLRYQRLRQNHALQSAEKLVNAIYEKMNEERFFDPLKPFDPAEEVIQSYLQSTDRDNPESSVNSQIKKSVDALFLDHKSALVSSEDKRKLYQNFADLLENRVLQQSQKPNELFAKMEEARIPNEQVTELLKQVALGLPLPNQKKENAHRNPHGLLGDEHTWTLMGTAQMVYFDIGAGHSRGAVENESTNRMIEDGISENPYIIPVLPHAESEKRRTPIQILHEKAFLESRKTLYVKYDQKQEQPYFCDSNGMAIERDKLGEYKPEAGKPLFLEPHPGTTEVNEHGKDTLFDPSIPLGQRVNVRAEGTLNMAALELCPHLAVASRVTHRTKPGQPFAPKAQMDKDSLPVPIICAMMASSLLGGKTYLMKKAQDVRHPGKSEYRSWEHIRSLMVQKNKQRAYETTYDDKDILLGITDIGPGIPLNQQIDTIQAKRESRQRKKANQIMRAHQTYEEQIPHNLYQDKMGRSLLDLGLVIPPGTMEKEHYQNLAIMMGELCSLVSKQDEHRSGDWITIRVNEKEFGGETASENFREHFQREFGIGKTYTNRVRFFPWSPADGSQIDAILLNPPSPAQDNENRDSHFRIAQSLADFLQRNPMPTLFLSSHTPVEPGKCAIYGTPEERRKICVGNQMISSMEPGDRANSRWFSEPTCNPGGLVRWPKFADMNVMEFVDPEQYGNQRCCVTSPEAAKAAAEHIFDVLVSHQAEHIQYLKPMTRMDCEQQNKGEHNNHPPMDPNQAYGTQLGDVYMEQIAAKSEEISKKSSKSLER